MPPSTYPVAALRRTAALLAGATRIAVLSGAGLSKASGISTYRDEGGLWTVDANFLKYAHVAQFHQNPAAFTSFWKARRKELAKAQPNAAHRALAQLQALKPGTTLITQNVDGLLERAGCRDVLELHGSLARHHCLRCGQNRYALAGRCLACFSRMRPSVVLFGESLEATVLEQARQAAQNCQVLLVVGTTAEVLPAAGLPALALRCGAKLVVLDPEPPLLANAADETLQGSAEVLLPELLARLQDYAV